MLLKEFTGSYKNIRNVLVTHYESPVGNVSFSSKSETYEKSANCSLISTHSPVVELNSKFLPAPVHSTHRELSAPKKAKISGSS